MTRRRKARDPQADEAHQKVREDEETPLKDLRRPHLPSQQKGVKVHRENPKDSPAHFTKGEFAPEVTNATSGTRLRVFTIREGLAKMVQNAHSITMEELLLAKRLDVRGFPQDQKPKLKH